MYIIVSVSSHSCFLSYTTTKSGIIHACRIATFIIFIALHLSTVLTCPITGIMQPKFDYHLIISSFSIGLVHHGEYNVALTWRHKYVNLTVPPEKIRTHIKNSVPGA